MEKEEIDKMFEGRWHYKCGDFEGCEVRQLTGNDVKALCKDFFEAGLLLSSDVVKDSNFTKAEITFDDGSKGSVIYEHDPGSDIMDDSFEYWWNCYDLKCGRGNCEKKWSKLTQKEKRECIAATPAYVASTPDKQYRKRPLTYLNQKAWEDEIINRNNREQQRQQRIVEAAELAAKYAGVHK